MYKNKQLSTWWPFQYLQAGTILRCCLPTIHSYILINHTFSPVPCKIKKCLYVVIQNLHIYLFIYLLIYYLFIIYFLLFIYYLFNIYILYIYYLFTYLLFTHLLIIYLLFIYLLIYLLVWMLYLLTLCVDGYCCVLSQSVTHHIQ